MRALIIVGVVGALGCSGPPVAAPPTVRASSSPSSDSADPPVVASSAQPSAQPPPTAPSAERHFELRNTPVVVTLDPGDDEPVLADACDLSRLYRGHVGKTPVSLWLRAQDGRLAGEVHYDLSGPGIVVAGKRTEAGVTITERGAGTFVGSCDPATGLLSGVYTLGGTAQLFALRARPKSWPALHMVKRDREVGAPSHRCGAHDRGLRLFAIPAGPRAAINRALSRGEHVAQLRDLNKCSEPVQQSARGEVYFAGDGVLTVVEALAGHFGAMGVHQAWTGGRSFDLTSGREITLSDVVRDLAGLRRLLTSCIHDYEETLSFNEDGRHPVSAAQVVDCQAREGRHFLWDCGDPQPPKWALMKEGIAILGSGFITVEAIRGSMGPIVSWEALLREGALVPGSPVARLWKDREPAGADEPSCTSGHVRSRMVHWRQVP
jgi:hypothetical protein